MPTYQYRCSECDHFFEQVQSFSDDSLTECPQCQGLLRKVFNAVGVVFKGSGFYKTDSRSTNGSTAGGSSGSGTTSNAGSDAGTTSSSSSDSSSKSSSTSSSSNAAASTSTSSAASAS